MLLAGILSGRAAHVAHAAPVCSQHCTQSGAGWFGSRPACSCRVLPAGILSGRCFPAGKAAALPRAARGAQRTRHETSCCRRRCCCLRHNLLLPLLGAPAGGASARHPVWRGRRKDTQGSQLPDGRLPVGSHLLRRACGGAGGMHGAPGAAVGAAGGTALRGGHPKGSGLLGGSSSRLRRQQRLSAAGFSGRRAPEDCARDAQLGPGRVLLRRTMHAARAPSRRSATCQHWGQQAGCWPAWWASTLCNRHCPGDPDAVSRCPLCQDRPLRQSLELAHIYSPS